MAGKIPKKAAEEIARCVRCGACQAVCPVYQAEGREHSVARGKIHLLEKACAEGGGAFRGRRLRQAMSECLKCGRCTGVCPNAVETAEVVRAAREAGFKSPSAKVWAVKKALGSRGMMRAGAGMLDAFKGMVAEDIKGRPGLVMRLSAPGEKGRRAVPRPQGRSFLSGLGGKDLIVEGRGKHLFFTGCVGDVLRPSSSRAVVELVKRAGAGLVVPFRQSCCGLMAYYAGDAGTARELALENIGRFAEYGADAIVTTCATCAVMLEKHYREFGGEKLPQVLTFSQFWAKVGAGASVVGAAEAKRSPPAGDPPLLAFHEPCHLRLGLGVKSGPRELLKSLKGARYVKTAGEDDCCGYGGVLNLENYDLSMKIGSGKRETLEAGGAGIVVTECAGCILQLTDILSRSEKPFEIITTAEAVERYA